MKIGRFIFNRLLNKRQREIVLQALVYSAHTYKRRGDAEGYSEVSRVIGELSDKFGLKERTYTKKDVEEIVHKISEQTAERLRDLSKQSYKKGYEDGFNKIPISFGIIRSKEGIVPGMQFSKEKCESCEHKDECTLYALLKEEFDSEEDKAEEEKKETVESGAEKKEQV